MLPCDLRYALARAPGVKRLYSRLVGLNRLTIAPVLGGPLRGSLIQFDPAVENRYWGGDYEADAQELLARLPIDGAVAWDVGAHVGFFSLLLARRCRQVTAIEPGPGNAERLRTNVKLNNAPIEVVEAAVGRVPGTAMLTVMADGRTNHVAPPDAPGIAVPQVTLDQLAELYGFPDFVKIDIEGAELDALLGANAVLAARPLLLVEAHSPALVEQVTELLGSHGYAVERLGGPPGGRTFVPTRLIARAG